MRKYPRLFLVLLFFLFLIFISIFPNLYDYWHPLEFKFNSDAFIYSVYYYPISKSLGEHAIAMNMVINQNAIVHPEKLKIKLVGSNDTHFELFEGRIQVDGIEVCSYITTILVANTMPNLKSLRIISNDNSMLLPIKHPKSHSPSPVIICISPQFVAEQWQLFLLQVHIIRRFQGHPHLYITSMVDTFFELVSKYDKLGYVTIDYWNRIKFNDNSEPMRHVEWRNQAGAQTDCLLQYKEVAEYISFFDLDDVLIPSIYSTYLQEFNSHFPSDLSKSYLFYERQVHNFKKMENFSFDNFKLEEGTKIDMGKSVIRPEKFNSTWIHFSWNVDFSKGIKIENQYIKHIQVTDNSLPLAKPLRDSTYLQKDFTGVHQNFQSHILPNDFYFNIIRQCYNDIYYKKGFIQGKLNSKCLNPEECEYPQVKGIECIHADAQYFSGPRMEPITFHWIDKQFWNTTYGCYP